MEGVAATNGVGLPSVGLLVGHADAAGSVIVRIARGAVRRVMLASIFMRLFRLLSPFCPRKMINTGYEESCPVLAVFTRGVQV